MGDQYSDPWTANWAFFGSFSHNFEDFDHEDVARGDNNYYLKLKFSS